MKTFFIKNLVLVSTITTLLMALLTACSTSAPIQKKTIPETLTGNWFVEKIFDEPTLQNSKVELAFNAENRLSGSASCNNMSSMYTIKNNALTIGPIAATRKMCSPALMKQESSLLKAFSKVKRFQLSNGQLSMFDQKGSLLVEATRTKL